MCKGCLCLREMNLICFNNIVLLTGCFCIGPGIDSRLVVLASRPDLLTVSVPAGYPRNTSALK